MSHSAGPKNQWEGLLGTAGGRQLLQFMWCCSHSDVSTLTEGSQCARPGRTDRFSTHSCHTPGGEGGGPVDFIQVEQRVDWMCVCVIVPYDISLDINQMTAMATGPVFLSLQLITRQRYHCSIDLWLSPVMSPLQLTLCIYVQSGIEGKYSRYLLDSWKF